MSSIGGNSNNYSDTNSKLFNQEVISVGTTQVEAITASLVNREDRQILHLFNKGNQTIYYGPTGVTSTSGIPLLKDEWVEIYISSIPVFLITSTSTANVIITELG